MFTDEIAGYNRHYVSHARLIAFRSSRAKISKEEPYLNIQEVHGNFDLLFSKDGRLLETIHFDSNNQFNVSYVYSKRRLIKAIKLNKVNNEVQEITGFRYDQIGRIRRENWHSYMGVISDGGDFPFKECPPSVSLLN